MKFAARNGHAGPAARRKNAPTNRTPSLLPDVDRPAPMAMPVLPDAVARDIVQLFKLLADETRLRVLFYLLNEEEFHVRALCDLLQQSQPAVSHHLAMLREAGLIQARREGKHNFYHLRPRRFEELLNKMFAAFPKNDRRQQFQNWVQTFAASVG